MRLQTMLVRLQSWWTYGVTERMGYRRPSPVTPSDLRLRDEAEQKEQHLRQTFETLHTQVLRSRAQALDPIIPRQEVP